MIKENEAKKLWCPLVRFNSNGATNRDQVIDKEENRAGISRCLASNCMAWRETVPQRKFNHANISGRIVIEEAEGYCGLAGKP